MAAQLHLFGARGRPQGPLGIKVRQHKPCKCGCAIAVVGPGKAMHAAEIRCSDCIRFIRWLSQHERAAVMRAASSPFAPEILSLPPREGRGHE
jgi:hypothetical protein